MFVWLMGACTPVSSEIVPTATPEAVSPTPADLPVDPAGEEGRYTLAQVRELAGFDVREPTYLPAGVSFEYAAHQASPDVLACPVSVENCEVLQIGDTDVVYQLTAGGTEGMDWFADGVTYRLLRTAGEPGKIYKDELAKVVESMK
jgi:hypothetical protein